MTSNLTINSTLPLGTTSIYRLGLGTWRSDKGLTKIAVKTALLAGYRHLDCAWIYSNEDEVGAGIADAMAENKSLTRESFFITSKIWNDSHEAEEMKVSVDETLRNLRTPYVDLLLVHWPVHWKKFADNCWGKDDSKVRHFNHSMTMEKMWRTMETFVSEGKAKAIGVSNFDVEECKEVMRVAKIKPSCNQVERHPYFNQREFVDAMRELGMVVTSYCPLAQLGRPVGDPLHGVTALDDPVIKELAAKYNKSPAQIIIRWHLQCNVVVIPKSTTPQRIIENANVFDFELSEEDFNKVEQLGKRNIRFVNPDFRENGRKIFEDGKSKI